MCAANCGQLASTKIGWANKAKEIAVDTARLVEVESKFQFYPQCSLSSPPCWGGFFSRRQPSFGHAARRNRDRRAKAHDGVAINAGNAISGANALAFGKTCEDHPKPSTEAAFIRRSEQN
jgi:hypothetical protein